MKLLILQEIIPVYRKRLFNFFASYYPDIELTIASTTKNIDNLVPKNLNYKHLTVSNWGGFKWVKEDIRREIAGYDVVIVMFDIRWISFMSLLFGRRNSKILLWGHGFSNNSSSIIISVRRYLATKADALVFYNTDRMKLFSNSPGLHQKSFVADNTLVVKNHGYNSTSERNSILFVGRINKNKQVLDLLRAFVLISPKISTDIQLVIIGDGESKSAIVEEAKLSGITNIKILDAIYDEDKIKAHYDRSIVSVIPGTVGLGIVTSFAYGVPIVYAEERFHGPEIKYANDSNSYKYDGTILGLSNILIDIIESEDIILKSHSAYNFYRKNLMPEVWAKKFMQACLF